MCDFVSCDYPTDKMSSSDVRENSTVHHSAASMWILLTNFGVIDSLITFILELQRSRTALAWCQTVSSELLTFFTPCGVATGEENAYLG